MWLGATTTLFSSQRGGQRGITLKGVTISNAGGQYRLQLHQHDRDVSIQGNNINTSAGTLLSINGGSAAYTIAKGTVPDRQGGHAQRHGNRWQRGKSPATINS